ncbi:hypothetical protein BB561_002013 [Smittium simulii]|uniref:RING-type domain-containing protein n=1 Tax=Smittium simulii TaxID=133385 RepID=A0A2T9YS13_9FUNG|nr:hypothetical protein BB561_002013 [Smittium simulii]
MDNDLPEKIDKNPSDKKSHITTNVNIISISSNPSFNKESTLTFSTKQGTKNSGNDEHGPGSAIINKSCEDKSAIYADKNNKRILSPSIDNEDSRNSILNTKNLFSTNLSFPAEASTKRLKSAFISQDLPLHASNLNYSTKMHKTKKNGFQFIKNTKETLLYKQKLNNLTEVFSQGHDVDDLNNYPKNAGGASDTKNPQMHLDSLNSLSNSSHKKSIENLESIYKSNLDIKTGNSSNKDFQYLCPLQVKKQNDILVSESAQSVATDFNFEKLTQKSNSDTNYNVDGLNCPICLGLISDAYMTVCGHSFCCMCIKKHLSYKLNCPCCGQKVNSNQIFPNFSLSSALEKLQKHDTIDSLKYNLNSKDSLLELLKLAIQSSDTLDISDIRSLKNLFTSKLYNQTELQQNSSKNLLKTFLKIISKKTQKQYKEVLSKMELLNSDIKYICSNDNLAENLCDNLYQSTEFSIFDTDTSGYLDDFCEQDDLDYEKKITNNLQDLENIYYSHLKKSKNSRHTQNSKLLGVLSILSKYKRFKPDAMFRYGDGSSSTAIVSSIEFDKNDTIFAVSGADLWKTAARSKLNKNKLTNKDNKYSIPKDTDFEADDQWPYENNNEFLDKTKDNFFNNIAFSVNDVTNTSSKIKLMQAMPITPISEIVNRFKISCLSYNSFNQSYLACSDYEGLVTVWDTKVNVGILSFSEHDKRTWSVDFSKTDPNLLCSGSDDGKVKIWNINNRNSVTSIEGKANICCVRFNPKNSNFVAFGSADHNIYYYDLRHTGTPYLVLKDHKKAVSYVRFASNNNLVSASTDSTLKLWDLDSNHCVRTYSGHVNEKNFVGLSIGESDWISCGSENNAVYAYNLNMSKPVLKYEFDDFDSKLAEPVEKDPSLFVGAVCWKKNTSSLIAANSQGLIRILSLDTQNTE